MNPDRIGVLPTAQWENITPGGSPAHVDEMHSVSAQRMTHRARGLGPGKANHTVVGRWNLVRFADSLIQPVYSLLITPRETETDSHISFILSLLPTSPSLLYPRGNKGKKSS